MSTIVADELITSLAQTFFVKTPLNIASIKPCVVAVNPIMDDLMIEILQGVDVLFSKQISFLQLKSMLSTSNNCFHGFFPFSPESSLYLVPGEYSLRMSATGYTFSKNNFIGWVKDHNHYIGNIYGTEPENYTMYPYSFRIIEYK